jgi:hypothetical protein
MSLRSAFTDRHSADFSDENTEITDHWLEYIQSRETQDAAGAQPGIRCADETLHGLLEDACRNSPSAVPIECVTTQVTAAPTANRGSTLRGLFRGWFTFRPVRKLR